MSSIDDYFGLSEPVEKQKTIQEMSIKERVAAFRGSSQLALNKSSEYFEETYKKIVPDPELDKEIEEMFYESPIEPKNEPEMDYTMRRYYNKLSEIMNP